MTETKRSTTPSEFYDSLEPLEYRISDMIGENLFGDFLMGVGDDWIEEQLIPLGSPLECKEAVKGSSAALIQEFIGASNRFYRAVIAMKPLLIASGLAGFAYEGGLYHDGKLYRPSRKWMGGEDLNQRDYDAAMRLLEEEGILQQLLQPSGAAPAPLLSKKVCSCEITAILRSGCKCGGT